MATSGMIIVIYRAASEAQNIKELIEFMDAPEVRTATPSDWQETIGSHRLDAVFLGLDLTESEVRDVVGDVAKVDRNIPIVMLQNSQAVPC